MSTSDPEIAAYSQALVRALRATDVDQFRQFAATWGARLGNRGLKQLARASPDVVERRMWMMIYDRPDLADLHQLAEAWLAEHAEPDSTGE
jgi:hypothetical protein